MTTEPSLLMHASAVSVDGHAALITGASGSGKSALALQLLALGCELVADDQCRVYDHEGMAWVEAPANLPGLIEARGVGLLPIPLAGPAKIMLVVDMDNEAVARLPEAAAIEIAGHHIPQINKARGPHFPSAVLLYLKGTLLT